MNKLADTDSIANPAKKRREINRIARRVNLWLLLASTATIALLTAAALRETMFAHWRQLRAQYRELLEAKATDERGRETTREFELRLVQNFVPELGVVDRCVTCHTGVQDPRMEREAQPFTTHPGHYLEIHDPEKFGCTVCHGGQGRATEAADAHGHVPFWEYPLLPSNFIQSSCTKCHLEADIFGREGLMARAEGQITIGAELLERGCTLVRESGCLGCHSLNGKGGNAGPDLSAVGSKTPLNFSFAHLPKEASHEVGNWLKEHFLDPARISPGSIMPRVTEIRDAEALTAYALSRRRREIGQYFYSKRLQHGGTEDESGRDLYARYCSACHGLNGRGGRVPSIRTPLLNIVKGDGQRGRCDNSANTPPGWSFW